MITIGLIKEGKIPPDFRVPLTPKQCAYIQEHYPVKIVVQPSSSRCYTNEEYRKEGIKLSENLSKCTHLMGVKEVPVDQLLPNKTYFIFSHTIKEQSYNRKLLQAILKKNIKLIDYEVLRDDLGRRLIAFGFFAGIVGAHNGIYTFGTRTGLYVLKRMKDCHDYEEALSLYKKLELPPMKIVVTGTGRVATGAVKVLQDMGIRKVAPDEFIKHSFEEAVYTQLACIDYAQRKDGKGFEKEDFYAHPELYKGIFKPYTRVTDVMINGIYWDNKAPAFFTKEEMRSIDFHIKVIADVTCDIAPVSSIPSTLKATTIAEPVFGYNPHTEQEASPFQDHVIDMMTIDNLPNELPRDASNAFGEQFIKNVLEPLLANNHPVIERATITENGQLGKTFSIPDGLRIRYVRRLID